MLRMTKLWEWFTSFYDVLMKYPELWGCLIFNILIFLNFIISPFIIRRKAKQAAAIIVDNIESRQGGNFVLSRF